ncbi:3915_t:CDS:2 [Entrophospora sp. SA101]|nr:3915_t:CDS:2 [Entrophospora sp. SA101]CAJ0835083.1 9546_t:CDS:2 [Entrophospora sp. SA101]CAJ0836196.1 15227_t:CDS:2 [Entrophospora sp. SA101]CAJ0839395.1 21829_t:CDS:2 [Entrophospora sp. SA101]CAJ0904798.1 5770_t:CDS:2 [Entrophospora sp. SA101]
MVNAFQVKVEMSQMLQKWLEPRIAEKIDKGLSYEQAWGEIIKEISINALSTLPLNTFATAISNLNQMNVASRIKLIEKILSITPHPEHASGETINRISAVLVSILLPNNNLNGKPSSINVDPNFMKIAKSILTQSHNDWIDACDVLSNFLNSCLASYNFERNVYILYPFLKDVVKFVKSLDNNQKTGMDQFFMCLQKITVESGYKLKDLIQINVPYQQKVFSENFLKDYIPKCVPLTLFHSSKRNINCDIQRTCQKNNKKSLQRPRWHNQQQLILKILQNAPNYSMSHNELIDASIALDERLSAETGLPRVFGGQAPKVSVSACLTHNSEKYFKEFTIPHSKDIYYKLAFIPNDVEEAVNKYNNWMEELIRHDWPLCFGKLKKTKQGSALVNSGCVIMLSVGAATQTNLRCRQCPADTVCDAKLPLCSKCRAKRTLCIYPLRKVEHSHHTITKLKQNTSNKKHQTRTSKSIYDNDEDSLDIEKIPAATDEELMSGLDLTNVPKSLSDVVEVKESTILNAGNGLFAKRNLPTSTPLGFYFGIPMSEDEFDQHKDEVGRSSHYSMRYKKTILDATDDNGEPFTNPQGKIFCPFHFMNEDPFGNMVFIEGSTVNQVICLTKREIKKGEELFVYYGGEVDREHWGRAVINGDYSRNNFDKNSEENQETEEKMDISDDDTVESPTMPNNKNKRNKRDDDDYKYNVSKKSKDKVKNDYDNNRSSTFQDNNNDESDNSNCNNDISKNSNYKGTTKRKTMNSIDDDSKPEVKTGDDNRNNENNSNGHQDADNQEGDQPIFKTRRRVLRSSKEIIIRVQKSPTR